MEITENEHEIIIFLNAELISANIRAIESEINRYIETSTKEITLDLAQQVKIDSMSIAALIRIKNKLIEKGRGFKILNPSEGVTRVLEISGLESFLLD